MMPDELVQRVAALPADSDVGVQIGDDHLDITDVVASSLLPVRAGQRLAVGGGQVASWLRRRAR